MAVPAFIMGSLLILAMTGFSDANYCLCNPAFNDTALQRSIDYACGNGADCSQILQSGSCYNPNTVRDHCNYAVNSYYQRRNQILGSCDFSGTASPSANPPSTTSSACVYPSSPSNTGTPTTGTPTTGTPTTGTPTTGTPTTGTPTTGTPANGSPISGGTPNTGGTTFPGSTSGTGIGLGPTASGFPSTDNSSGVKRSSGWNGPCVLVSITLGLICGFIWS